MPNLTVLSRKLVHWPLTATLPDGTAATIAGVDVAFLPPGARPGGSTAWTAGGWNGQQVTVLLAGPSADPTGATVLDVGAHVPWFRVTDAPEVDVASGERVTVG